MKRFNFKLMAVLAMFALAAIFAHAQPKVSYSGTHYRSNGKLYSKDWVSVDGGNLRARNESIDEQTGKTRIVIFRQDSAKFYMLNPENKKAMVLPMSQIKGGINSLVGLDVEKSRTTKTELLGTEVIEGYECKHFLRTATSMLQNGTEDNSCFEYWLYEPFGVEMQHKEGCGYQPVITLKNFKQGVQPDGLFEIPKGYSIMELPAGGLIEMITGKSKAGNRKDADKAQQGADEVNKKFDGLKKNTEGKSETEKIQEALKMLEGTKKKK